MKNENITGGFKKLKQDLAGMTFKQKLEHLWTYYRSWVIVACAIVILISIFATSMINLSTKTVASGVCINVPLADGAEEFIKSGLETLKTGNGREKVYFQVDYTDPDDGESIIYMVQNMNSLVASKDLDFLILDQESLGRLATQSIFINPKEIFSQEELNGMTLITIDGSEEQAAIDISDWPIVKQNGDNPKQYYFAVIGNTPRPEAVKTALKLLQLYGAEE